MIAFLCVGTEQLLDMWALLNPFTWEILMEIFLNLNISNNENNKINIGNLGVTK